MSLQPDCSVTDSRTQPLDQPFHTFTANVLRAAFLSTNNEDRDAHYMALFVFVVLVSIHQ